MALVFCDSFDGFADGFDADTGFHLLSKWTTASNSYGIDAGEGRCGSNAMQMSAIATLYKGVPAETRYIVHFGLKLRSTGSSGGTYETLYFVGSGTKQFYMFRESDGSLSFYRFSDNALLAQTDPDTVRQDVWYHIGVDTTIHSSTGIIKCWVNEQLLVNSTGLNNRGSGGASITSIGFENSNNRHYIVDDVIILDGNGSSNNNFLGDRHIEWLSPDNVGDTQEWDVTGAGTHHAALNNIPADDDTTYITSDQIGETDLCHISSPLLSTTSIDGAQINIRATKVDPGTATLSPVIRSGGSNAVGSAQAASESSYSYLLTPYDVNPVTASAFTVAEIIAIQIGAQRTT